MAKDETKANEKAWKAFDKYWDSTEWEDLDKEEIAEFLEGSDAEDIKIPKKVSTPKIGKEFYNEVKEAIKPKRKAGGASYTFKGIEASAEDIFGKKPVPMTQLMSKLWDFIKDEDNGVKITKAKKPKEEDEDEDDE